MRKQKFIVNILIAVMAVFVCCFAFVACNPKNPPEPQEHVCAHVCDECGKCTSDCADSACADKCAGHADVPVEEQDFKKIEVVGADRYDFDIMAGYGKVSGASYESKPDKGNWVKDFSYKNNSRITLRVYAEEECEADVAVKVRMTKNIVTLTTVLGVSVDGEALESEAQVPASRQGENAEFYEVNLGRFGLLKGNNTFELVPQDSIDNFDVMSMVFYTDGVKLDWSDPVEAGKAFSAIDERVEITGDYEKDPVQNVIRCAGYTASSATFTVYSSRNALAKVSFALSAMAKDNVFTSYYDFRINGDKKISAAKTPYSTVLWANYTVVELGEYAVKTGANTISLSVGNVDWDNSFNIRALILDTEATVSFDEVEPDGVHTCVDECELCGKCTTDCEEPECAEKCDCYDATYKAIDDKVMIKGGIVKDTELGYVRVTDYSALNLVTYTLRADKAGKVTLYFKTSSNPNQWDFVDYFRVWINDKGAKYADEKFESPGIEYKGNRLDRNVYTVKTVIAGYDEFFEVKVGEIELSAGENEIVIGWACAGSADYRFQLEHMRLKSSEISCELIAPGALHECESECAVCGKCMNDTCEEFICAEKCECVDSAFEATDEKTYVGGGLTEDAEHGYVTPSDEFGSVTFTVNSEAAQTVELFLNVGGANSAINPREYFGIWVNDPRAREADADYVGNRLTGENGETVAVGESAVFSYVSVGTVSLIAGDNEIVIGYVGGTDNLLFKGIKIKAATAVMLAATESYEHVCNHVCAACGGCTDTCEDEACANKCACVKLTVSALDVNVQKSAGLANNVSGNYVYATGYTFTYLVFDIHTDTAGKAIMSFEIGGNPTEPNTWGFVGFFRVWINDPNLDLTTVDASYSGNRLLEADYPVRTKYAGWEEFSEITLGTVDLAAGDNKIVLGWASIDMIAAYNVDAKFNVRSMSLESSLNASLIETIPHECAHACAVCGKCTTDCDKSACASKCECVKYTFKAVDEKVLKSSNLLCSERDFVFAGGYFFTYMVFDIEVETVGKVVLSFNIGGNPTADWTFVDFFRVWINDPDIQLDTVDSAYVGNKLDKNVYTAKTVKTDWETFGEIVVGTVELKAGSNRIVLGWDNINMIVPYGVDAKFYVRDMSITAASPVTFAEPESVEPEQHVCADVCAACSKCTSECTDPACAEKCTCESGGGE